jgi:hypothetical protein
MIHLRDETHLGAGKRFRVLNVVAFEEEDSRIRPGCYGSRRQLQPAYGVFTLHWHAPGAGLTYGGVQAAGLLSPFSGTRSPWP